MKYYIERIIYNADRTQYTTERIPIRLEELNDFQEKPIIHTDEKQICIICGQPMFFFGNPYEKLFNTFLCLKCVREGRIPFPR